MAEGTITKRFLGPGCHMRARSAADELSDMNFDVTAFSSGSWKDPRTWFMSSLEGHFSVRKQSSEEVLGVVKGFYGPVALGWKIHPSST